MKNVLLCVDYNNVLFRATATHLSLTSDSRFTGGLYGFIKHLTYCVNEVGATHVVICKDSPPYLRRQAYPGYKGNRAHSDDTMFQKAMASKPLIDSFIEHMGLSVWELKGYEADDMMALACTQFSGTFDEVVLVTNDSDLYQFLEFENVSLFKGKSGRYSYSEFNDEFPTIQPRDWALVSALVGTHNEVVGIKGVGPKTAIKYVNDRRLLADCYLQNKELIDNNCELIHLPHPTLEGHPFVACLVASKARYEYREMVRWLGFYEITMAPFMKDAFEAI